METYYATYMDITSSVLLAKGGSVSVLNKYSMLFAGCEVRIVKNVLFLSNHFYNCSSLPRTHRARFTVTVVRDKKIRTGLRTNQIAGVLAVPAGKKNVNIFMWTEWRKKRVVITTDWAFD